MKRQPETRHAGLVLSSFPTTFVSPRFLRFYPRSIDLPFASVLSAMASTSSRLYRIALLFILKSVRDGNMVEIFEISSFVVYLLNTLGIGKELSFSMK